MQMERERIKTFKEVLSLPTILDQEYLTTYWAHKVMQNMKVQVTLEQYGEHSTEDLSQEREREHTHT